MWCLKIGGCARGRAMGWEWSGVKIREKKCELFFSNISDILRRHLQREGEKGERKNVQCRCSGNVWSDLSTKKKKKKKKLWLRQT